MSFGPIPGYQSRQTHTSQRTPSIKCSHTRKRAQYRKLYFSSPHHGKKYFDSDRGLHYVPESEISFSSFSVLVHVKAYPRVLTYIRIAKRFYLNGMCSVKNDGFTEKWTLGTWRIAVFAYTLLPILFLPNLVFALAQSIFNIFPN